MPTARLPGVEIYYEERGRGEPLLMVPPSWWPAAAWKVSVLDAIAPRHRAILFDPRGTGRSSRPEHGYSVRQFALDAIALLHALGIERCHVAGFALGAQIAQAMALERPALLATLTMAAAGPGRRPGSGAKTGEVEAEIRRLGFERYIRSHADNDRGAFSGDFYRAHPEIARALAQALWEAQSGIENFLRHHEARATWDALAAAPRVAVPTLILVGGQDEVARGDRTPLATARRLAELIPGAELAVIPGVKHMTFWDGGAALAAMLKFIARHPIETKPESP
jgi:3-oxoadipate enol-lactonase